jgi:hypothetical protein
VAPSIYTRTIRPDFDRSITIDFQGAEITSDTGFLLLREMDERFGVLGPMESELAEARSRVHSKHTQLQMLRQGIYQMAAGFEDCNDAGFLRINPALRLAIGKDDEAGAGQSRLSRLENADLGAEDGLKALVNALKRSNDALVKRKKKQRLSWVGARVAYHGRRWQVHVASALPLVRYYRAVFG